MRGSYDTYFQRSSAVGHARCIKKTIKRLKNKFFLSKIAKNADNIVTILEMKTKEISDDQESRKNEEDQEQKLCI